MTNHNKSVHCTADGVYVYYNDTKKHQFQPYANDSILQIQLYGNSYRGKQAQDFEETRYNFQQNKLYLRCLYGIKSCSPAELSTMTWIQKNTLKFNHKKTQQLINLSKWNATSQMVNSIITKVFDFKATNRTRPSNFQWFMDITKEIIPQDNALINMSSLELIGGKAALIEKLIDLRILPSNFYTLKAA